MFDSPYPFHYCGIDKAKVRPNLLETHLFRFKDRHNHSYIVRAERYPDDFYAIKYYLKAHKLSDNRYNLMTHAGLASKVFGTCVEVMKHMYYKNSRASFGVIGAPSIGEGVSTTKRFRIYSLMLMNLFPPTVFVHSISAKDSAYFLLNKQMVLMEPDFPKRIYGTFDLVNMAI